MKKLISLLLVICMLTSALSLSMFATNAEEIPSEDDILAIKERAMQTLQEKYDNGTSWMDDGNTYSWSYDDEADETSTDTGITPYWSSGSASNPTSYGIHGQLIDEVCADSEVLVPVKYRTLIKDICKMCDKQYGASTDNTCKAFHASGNYVATLKYLWLFAKKLAVVDDLTVDKIKSISKEVYYPIKEKIELSSIDEEKKTKQLEILSVLRSCSKYIVVHNYEIPEGVTNQTESKRAKYIVYGMMYHFLGDLYAHRIIVPKTAVDRFREDFAGTINNATMFDPEHFKTYKDKRDEFISKVDNQELQFNDIADYYNSSFTRNYADNVNFYPDRYNEAYLAMMCFNENFSQGYTSFVLNPCYNFVLKNFDEYDEIIGF